MARITAQPVQEETSIQEKVYNLYLELKEAKNDKKETVKAHNENIKRIEGEIDDLLNEVVGEVQAAQQEAE